MNVKVSYHNSTDTITLRIEKEPGVVAYTSTTGMVGVEMSVEKWLEVLAALRDKIKAVQLINTEEAAGEPYADLAAKIAEHGPAT